MTFINNNIEYAQNLIYRAYSQFNSEDITKKISAISKYLFDVVGGIFNLTGEEKPIQLPIHLLNLQPGDTCRGEEVVHLPTIFHRAFFFFKELFSGGRAYNDAEAFKKFYDDIKPKIADLTGRLEKSPNDENFRTVQTVLKIQARIANSGWRAKEYALFQQDVENLQKTAKDSLKRWTVTKMSPENKEEISRWINSDLLQRRFAETLNAPLPHKWDEIPPGGVILCNLDSWMLGHHLQNRSLSIFQKLIKKIKIFMCKLLSGKAYTHAELSLGRGQTFDLDKREGTLCQGVTKIQERGNKTCVHDIIVPNEEEMLKAYNRTFPEDQLHSFKDLWARIEKEARNSQPLLQASFKDVFGVGLKEKRPKDYDCRTAWQPGVKNYGCSATISALFGKFGIDIGKKFDKKDKNVTPADLSNSPFFQHKYIIT